MAYAGRIATVTDVNPSLPWPWFGSPGLSFGLAWGFI